MHRGDRKRYSEFINCIKQKLAGVSHIPNPPLVIKVKNGDDVINMIAIEIKIKISCKLRGKRKRST